MRAPTRLLAGWAIVLAFYILAAHGGAAAMSAVGLAECEATFLSQQCALGPDRLVSPLGNLSVAASALLLTLWIRLFRPDALLLPFLYLFGGLALLAGLFDLVVEAPVIRSERIINDTANILGAVIAGSFLLILAILRHEAWRLHDLARAAAVSYALKTLAIAAFMALRGGVYGASELFLLYILYAFGAFSLHLMTLATFIARVPPRPAPREVRA